jgi:large subunit ribosomal protein L25
MLSIIYALAFGRKMQIFNFFLEFIMSLTINATTREDQGKGASRRLRKVEQTPAIIYGTGKAPTTVALNFHEISHLLENEESYTSIIDLILNDKKESVIIKDLQRHPARNTITHIDFLRVDMSKPIVTSVPLNFVGLEENEALRLGAILNQFITSVEVSCLPKDLPHAIEVQVANLVIGEHISLTGLNIPESLTITALTHGDIEAHDQSVVAVQASKKMSLEDESDEAVATGEESGDATQD